MGVGRFTAMLLLIYGFNNTVGALELSIATYLSVCATGDLGLTSTYEQYGFQTKLITANSVFSAVGSIAGLLHDAEGPWLYAGFWGSYGTP